MDKRAIGCTQDPIGLLNMAEQQAEEIRREARKLAEQLQNLQGRKSAFNAEIRRLTEEENEVKIELTKLLEETESKMIKFDKRTGDRSFVVIGQRSGGGHRVEPWSKQTVVLARNLEHAKEIRTKAGER